MQKDVDVIVGALAVRTGVQMLTGLWACLVLNIAWADADLGIIMTVYPDPVVVDSELDYAISVTILGPSEATDVVVTGDLPAGVTVVSAVASQGTCTTGAAIICNLGSISADSVGSAWVRISAVAPSTPMDVGNAVTVTSSSVDPDPYNNSANASTTAVPVSESADLVVTIRDDPDPVWTQGSITYTLLVTNNGPLGSPEVTVVFNGVTFAGLQLVHLRSIETSLGLCATALDSYVGIGRFLTLAESLIAACDLGFLGPGNTAEVTVVVDVPIEREAGDTIGVASYIETATSLPDPDLTNNNAEEQTAVAERPPYEYDSNDDGGGGGCTLSGFDEPDVTLPALLVIATGYFIRLSPRKRRSKK